MSNPTPPATPTLDRLNDSKAEADAVFEFLEWLESKGIMLAHYAEVGGYRDEQLVPVPKPGRSLMFEWLGLDENAMEDERRAVLAHHVAITNGESQ